MKHDRIMAEDHKEDSGMDSARRGRRGPFGRPEEPTPRDGRAARTVRTRKAVADALLDLISEGELRPTSKSIAERARVSERTIFQHFEDLETLFSAAAERAGDRIVSSLRHIPYDGPFETRLSIYLDEMVYLHQGMTSVRRASRLHEPFSPGVDSALGRWRETLRKGIDRVFEVELAQWGDGEDQRQVREALALLVSWSSWENMCRHSEFTSEQARGVLELSFRALLRQPAVTPEAAPAD